MRHYFSSLKMVIFSFVFVLFGIKTIAQTNYTLTDNDVIVTNGRLHYCFYDFSQNAGGTNLTIPGTLRGQVITAIGGEATGAVFKNKNIASVVLPEGLTYIGPNAFAQNNITDLDLSACTRLLTIGNAAFEDNSISSLDLSGCSSLHTIGMATFMRNNITSIDFSDCSSLVSIEHSAFNNNNISSLTINNLPALTTIGDQAFFDNNISSLDLSGCSALVTIGESAFNDRFRSHNDPLQDNLITSLNLSNCTSLASLERYSFADNIITSVDFTNCSALSEIGEMAFSGDSINSLDFSDCLSLTTIGTNAFHRNKVSSLNLSNCTSLQSIQEGAFGHNDLTSVDLSGCTMLTTIEGSAFRGNAITSVNLSGCSALTSLGPYVFYGNPFAGFVLPSHTVLSSLGWIDNLGGTYSAGGNSSTNKELSYSIPGEGTDYYTITYKTNGGRFSADNPSAYLPGSGVAAFTNAVKDNYVFLGWYTDAEYTQQLTEIETGTTGNVELWAKYIYDDDYTVVFEPNQGEGIMAEQSMAAGETANLTTNTFTRTGYSFSSWNTESNGSGTTYTNGQSFTMDIEGLTLYAQWLANTYTITFHANGGSGTMTAQNIGYDESENISTNTFLRTGHRFTGWNTQSDGSGAIYSDGQSFTMNMEGITLYAQWTVGEYEITFDANGGEGSMETQNISYGESTTINPNMFSRINSSFTGWNTESDGSGTAYSDGQSITMNVEGFTLYAQWAVNTYEITFDPNGGTGHMAAQSIGFGESADINTNTFTRTGFSFVSWNTESDGSGTAYSDGQSITMNVEGLTLYAQWAVNTYEITFDPNGGTGHMAAQSIGFGESADINTNTFTRTGFSFVSWNTESDGSGTSYTNGQSFTMNVEGIALYAQWQIIATLAHFEAGDVEIYPNPAREHLYVEINDNDFRKIEIFALTGEKVFEKSIKYTNTRTTIDLLYLDNGFYLVHISGKNKRIYRKILVNR